MEESNLQEDEFADIGGESDDSKSGDGLPSTVSQNGSTVTITARRDVTATGTKQRGNDGGGHGLRSMVVVPSPHTTGLAVDNGKGVSDGVKRSTKSSSYRRSKTRENERHVSSSEDESDRQNDKRGRPARHYDRCLGNATSTDWKERRSSSSSSNGDRRNRKGCGEKHVQNGNRHVLRRSVSNHQSGALRQTSRRKGRSSSREYGDKSHGREKHRHCRGDNDDRDKGGRRRTPTSPYRHRTRHIKPDRFVGKSCVETFLSKFESCSKYNRWNLLKV